MSQSFATKFYHSKQWLECRESYITLVHGLCERCSGPGYIVHHKIYLTPENINDVSITLSFDNLEYLCLDCHNLEHNEGVVTGEDCVFNSEGELIGR